MHEQPDMSKKKRVAKFLPSSSSLMSLAAWIPSSFRLFSICLDLARLALSSADMAHPMVAEQSRTRPRLILELDEVIARL